MEKRRLKQKRQQATQLRQKAWLESLRREARLASERVGKRDPLAHLRWLIDFANEDFASLSAGRRSDRLWEVTIFKWLTELKFGFSNLEKEADAMIADYDWSQTDCVSEAYTREFHDNLKQGIKQVFSESGWQLPSTTSQLLKSEGRRTIHRYYGEQNEATTNDLILHAADIIHRNAARVDLCENANCGRPFVALRSLKQKFCSPRCAVAIRVAKHRGKSPKTNARAKAV